MKLSRIWKSLTSNGPHMHTVRPEHWIVDADWSKWVNTRVEIPWEIHRNRKPNFVLMKEVEGKILVDDVPWRLAVDYDDNDTLIVKYERSNYPMEPRQEFTIRF